MSEEIKRWDSTEVFIATCAAFNALIEAKKELKHTNVLNPTIEDINTLQDLLIEQGYAIQKINNEKETNT